MRKNSFYEAPQIEIIQLNSEQVLASIMEFGHEEYDLENPETYEW